MLSPMIDASRRLLINIADHSQSTRSFTPRISQMIVAGTPLHDWRTGNTARFNVMHVLSGVHICNLQTSTLIAATDNVCAVPAEADSLNRTRHLREASLAKPTSVVPECDDGVGTAHSEEITVWRHIGSKERGAVCLNRVNVLERWPAKPFDVTFAVSDEDVFPNPSEDALVRLRWLFLGGEDLEARVIDREEVIVLCQ